MALPKVGVEAIIEGMAAFEADSKKVNKAFDDMDTGASKLGKGATGLTSHLTSLGASLLKMGAIAGGAALAGVAALSAGLATFAVGGIKQAIDLDQQVANIAATMGATQETAGTLKEELKGLALDLSLNPNLTVDVTQAGQAIEVLAANGALAVDEFGRLTQASKDLAVQTVALANATGSDFGTAATIATDAANIFGIEVDEMGKIVDGAAGIMNASKFDADDYSLALANVGPIAAGMGIPLEDLNTVLAGTASSFSSGSDAGTSFKTLLQRLANPTKEVQAAMDAYGISIFDADGNMRDMTDIAGDLNRVFFGTITTTEQVGGATKEQANAAATAAKNMDGLKAKISTNEKQLQLYNDQLALEIGYYGEGSPKVRQRQLQIEKLTNTINGQKQQLGDYEAAIVAVDGAQVQTITSTQQLTEAQRAQLAATLGGADGARILLGLAGMTSEEFNTLSESVNRSGQGLEAAALRVDTVKGAMDIFKGVLQAIQIQVGDKFLPLIKEMAVNFTQFATQQGPMIVDFFGQVATAIEGAINSISVSINKVVGAFQRFGARGAAVSILGQLGLEPEQIATVMSVVDQVTGAIDKITGAFQRFGLKGATVSIMGQLGIDPETIGLVFTTIDNLTTKISTLQAIFAQFGTMGAGISLLSMLGLSSENISLITTNIQAVVDGFNALADWWLVTWPAIQAAALTGWEILKGIFAGFQTALGPILTQLNTQFTQVFSQLGAILSSFGIDWQDVWNALATATGIVATVIGAAILGVIGVIAGLATGIAQAVSSAITMFQNLASNVTGIVTGLVGIFVGFNQALHSLLVGDWTAMWEGVKITLQGFATFFSNLWSGMITVATGSLNIITGLISGFVTGIIGFFRGMYNQLVGGSIVPDMINAIADWFKKLPQMVTTALSNLVSMVVQPFEDTLEAIGEMWKPEKWFEIGESIITGILEGIKENQAEVLEMLKSLAGDALQAAKDAIGFGSPAKEFMTIGESMVQGMLLGAKKENFTKKFIDDLNMGGIARSLGTGGGQWRNFRNIIKQRIGTNFEQLMTSGMSAGEIIGKIQDVAAKFNFPPSFASEFAMANGLIEHLTSSVTQFQQAMRLENMGRMAQIGGQFASIGQSLVDMLEPVNSEEIQLLRDFISGKVGGNNFFFNSMTGTVEELLTLQRGELGVNLDRVRAQEELNRLLEEQRRQEELITQQKEAQQKLSFLQTQIDLIKLGKELGGNIFQGITFGLNASVTDLLAATNNVVEAMVSQINSDLQISSPSKVMARIGQQMMAGLQGGIAAMTPVLNAQLSASVAGPLSPMMAGAMNSNSVSTTNMFNLGGNTISNGMQAAEFEARVLQVIRRNL